MNVELFLKKTKEYFGLRIAKTKKYGTLYVFMVSDDLYVSPITLKVAKAYSECVNASICVVPNPSSSSLHGRLIKSFLPERVIPIKRALFKTLGFRFFQIIKILFSIKKGADIERLVIDSVPVGKHLYDYLLRKNNIHTIEKIDLKLYIYIVAELAYYLTVISDFKRQEKIYGFFPDNTYRQGMVFEYFSKNNLQCLAGLDINDFTIHSYKHSADYKEHCRSVSLDLCKKVVNSESLMAEAREYLSSRVLGLGKQHDVIRAYAENKKILTKQEIVSTYRLDAHKPIILVAAHVYCDAPHAYPETLFQDYSHWLIETCKAISSNSNVNLLVKEHPSSILYGEKGLTLKILEKLGLGSLVLSDDIKTSSLFNVVDLVVTCGGTAGMEFGSFFVPVMTASSPPYSKLPFVIRSETQDEYLSKLKALTFVKKLPDEAAELAMASLYLINKGIVLNKSELGLGSQSLYLGERINEDLMLDELAADYLESTGYQELIKVLHRLVDGSDMNTLNRTILEG